MKCGSGKQKKKRACLPFGCKIYYRLENAGKFDDKAAVGVFVGYGDARKAVVVMDFMDFSGRFL